VDNQILEMKKQATRCELVRSSNKYVVDSFDEVMDYYEDVDKKSKEKDELIEYYEAIIMHNAGELDIKEAELKEIKAKRTAKLFEEITFEVTEGKIDFNENLSDEKMTEKEIEEETFRRR